MALPINPTPWLGPLAYNFLALSPIDQAMRVTVGVAGIFTIAAPLWYGPGNALKGTIGDWEAMDTDQTQHTFSQATATEPKEITDCSGFEDFEDDDDDDFVGHRKVYCYDASKPRATGSEPLAAAALTLTSTTSHPTPTQSMTSTTQTTLPPLHTTAGSAPPMPVEVIPMWLLFGFCALTLAVAFLFMIVLWPTITVAYRMIFPHSSFQSNGNQGTPLAVKSTKRNDSTATTQTEIWFSEIVFDLANNSLKATTWDQGVPPSGTPVTVDASVLQALTNRLDAIEKKQAKPVCIPAEVAAETKNAAKAEIKSELEVVINKKLSEEQLRALVSPIIDAKLYTNTNNTTQSIQELQAEVKECQEDASRKVVEIKNLYDNGVAQVNSTLSDLSARQSLLGSAHQGLMFCLEQAGIVEPSQPPQQQPSPTTDPSITQAAEAYPEDISGKPFLSVSSAEEILDAFYADQPEESSVEFDDALIPTAEDASEAEEAIENLSEQEWSDDEQDMTVESTADETQVPAVKHMRRFSNNYDDAPTRTTSVQDVEGVQDDTSTIELAEQPTSGSESITAEISSVEGTEGIQDGTATDPKAAQQPLPTFKFDTSNLDFSFADTPQKDTSDDDGIFANTPRFGAGSGGTRRHAARTTYAGSLGARKPRLGAKKR